jgi:hypothetical protein
VRPSADATLLRGQPARARGEIAQDGERYAERGRVGDTRILVREGLRLPDELHLEVDRHGRLHAFWNGQSWIG